MLFPRCGFIGCLMQGKRQEGPAELARIQLLVRFGLDPNPIGLHRASLLLLAGTHFVGPPFIMVMLTVMDRLVSSDNGTTTCAIATSEEWPRLRRFRR